MNDCWGGCGNNDEAASVSIVGPGSTRCARASVATSAVMGPPSSSTCPPTGVGILVARMQGGDEDVWQAIFDDD